MCAKRKFGITTETKAENNLRMNPPMPLKEPTAQFPNKWKFPIAKLVNVKAVSDFETKNGNTEVLQFTFKGKDNSIHTHTEWLIEDDDEKYEKRVEGMNSRIKHIYTQIFNTFPEKGIGTEATNWKEYFAAITDAFNSIKKDDKVVYPTVPLYLKLTYYKSNLNFPLSPNFVQRVEKDKPCKLEVNLQYDTVEQSKPSTPNGIPNIPGGQGGNDVPSFDNEYE